MSREEYYAPFILSLHDRPNIDVSKKVLTELKDKIREEAEQVLAG